MTTRTRFAATAAGLAVIVASFATPTRAEDSADVASLRAMVAEMATAMPNVDDGHCRATYPAFAGRQAGLANDPLLTAFNRVVQAHAIAPPTVDWSTRNRQPDEATCLRGLDVLSGLLEGQRDVIERLASQLPASR